MTSHFLQSISTLSSTASEIYEKIALPILSHAPNALGYPSVTTQSSYYLGMAMSQEEIEAISRFSAQRSIWPENTRIEKTASEKDIRYSILIASTETESQVYRHKIPNFGAVHVVHGDHTQQLQNICESLEKAQQYAENSLQKSILSQYIKSFRTGDMEAYRESQKQWVQGKDTSIESIFGFVEPYRDPSGVRAEFEGLVATVDTEGTSKLAALVRDSSKFIKRLPWVAPTIKNEEKGSFERPELQGCYFTSLYSLSLTFNAVLLEKS